MNVANYWFGTAHEMALYQIIGGKKKYRAGTNRDPKWLSKENDSVCELLLRAWRSWGMSPRLLEDGGNGWLHPQGGGRAWRVVLVAQLLPPCPHGWIKFTSQIGQQKGEVCGTVITDV